MIARLYNYSELKEILNIPAKFSQNYFEKVENINLINKIITSMAQNKSFGKWKKSKIPNENRKTELIKFQ